MTSDQKKKILVVDDEPEIRALIQEYLEESYVILLANNGEEAMRIVLAERPSLILTDVLMPKMSGYDFYRSLRQLKSEIGEIPIIIMSGRQSMQDYFEEWVIVSFLSKPFKGDELVAAVEKAILLAPEVPVPTVAVPAQNTAHVPQEEVKPDSKKSWVLIGGEEDLVLSALKKLLEAKGYAVESSSNEDEMVDKAWRKKPDLIICQFGEDTKIFNAMNVYKQLSEYETTYQIPFAAICSHALEAKIAETIEKERIIAFESTEELLKKVEPLL